MSLRPIIGTTQSFDDQHNMVVGSLSHFTVTVVNTTDTRFKHRSRVADVTMGTAGTGDLVSGVEYEIKTVHANDVNADFSTIGHINASVSTQKIEAGQKFIARAYDADGNEKPAGSVVDTSAFNATVVTHGSEHSILSLVIPSLQNIMTIAAIGKLDTATGVMRIAVENAGVAGTPQSTSENYSGLKPAFVLGVLNKAYNVTPITETTYFNVVNFDF